MDDHRHEAAMRKDITRPQLYVIVDNIRSLANVGTMFRGADGHGVRKIFLCGITPCPPRPEISKISLGAEDSVEWEWMEDPAKAVLILQSQNIPVVAIEQTSTSSQLSDYKFPYQIGLVVGNEVDGVDSRVINLVDQTLEIPMYGQKHSHNVAVACALSLYEIRRQWAESFKNL